ncbi:helix-turn-helix transcriptional regulator [Aeromonas hydrophila]|uniref:helix-turn-helix transcriptional regulator n=1 Tax=Aeromonas hydrophila TaxID=644 RepID=UPI002B49697B|nr:helix-turn-helix transcriptional regulator [Aeromonas hydrophila]
MFNVLVDGRLLVNRIAEIRKTLGKTQADLAKAAGWRVSRIGNYELGLRTPGLIESRCIVDALNSIGAECSLEEVFPPSN